MKNFQNVISLIVVTLMLHFSFMCKTAEEVEESVDTNSRTVEESVKPVVTLPDKIDLTQTSAWNTKLYSRHDERSFESIPKVNQRINFQNIDFPLLHAAIFYETNRRRKEMSIPPLEYSSALEHAATVHSQDMVKLGFYSHSSPVPGRESPKKRMEAYGINNAYTAENINIGFGIAYEGGRPVFVPPQNKGNYFSYSQDGIPLPPQTYKSLSVAVLDSWMNSAGHRKNILNLNLKYLGVGSAHYKDSKFYDMDKFKITQKFASIPGEIKK